MFSGIHWRSPRVQFGFKLGLSILLLAVLLFSVDLEALWENFQRLPLYCVPLAWAYYAFCQVLSSYRWQLFLVVKGVQVALSKLFSFYMVGMFLNNFLPSAVGGDVVKGYDLYRYTGKGSLAASSVFLERFTGLIGLALIAVVMTAWHAQDLDSGLIFAAVIGATVFLLMVVVILWYQPLMQLILKSVGNLLPQKIQEKFAGVYTAIYEYRQYQATMVYAILLSVFIQVLFAFYYSLIASAMQLEIPVTYFLLFLPLISLVSMLPISLGGLGIREVLMAVLFAEVGIPMEDVLAVSITVHVINTLLSLWGGALFVMRKKECLKQPVAESASQSEA